MYNIQYNLLVTLYIINPSTTNQDSRKGFT